MKLRRSFLPRRAVSLLVSTALCTSLLTFPAHAEVYTTNPDDSFQFDSKTQTFVQKTKSTLQTELERIGAIEDKRENYNERYQAYLSLCEQYPDIPVLRLKLAECMRSYEKDKSKVLQELETAIQLAETYQNWEDEDLVDYLDLDFSFGIFTSFSEAHSFTKDTFLRAAYGMEAGIYLDSLHQQENYIAAMRKSLQTEENSLRERECFSDDILAQIYGIDDDGAIVLNAGANIKEIMDAVSYWPYVTRELRVIKTKQKELDRIEEWYRSGSPVNFSAWDGRVTVDYSYWAGCTTVSVQNPTGYITSDTYKLMYRRSPAQVLRGLERVYLHWPTGTDYDGITETMIYADGSKKESKNSWSSATVGYELCSLQELELPDIVLQYVEANYSESPNDGVYRKEISYMVDTF